MDPRALENRVADLEKEVRKSKTFARAACIVACAVLASSALHQSRYFQRLRQLEIYDGRGRTRIVMEADPVPRLVFRSQTGENQIVLGLGDEERDFPFNHEHVPHLALQTDNTSILLSVRPAPRSENLEERFRVESATFQMSSFRGSDSEIQAKYLTAIASPNKSVIGIASYDPQDPWRSVFDPAVKLLVDETGKVTTKLGDEGEK